MTSRRVSAWPSDLLLRADTCAVASRQSTAQVNSKRARQQVIARFGLCSWTRSDANCIVPMELSTVATAAVSPASWWQQPVDLRAPHCQRLYNNWPTFSLRDFEQNSRASHQVDKVSFLSSLALSLSLSSDSKLNVAFR